MAEPFTDDNYSEHLRRRVTQARHDNYRALRAATVAPDFGPLGRTLQQRELADGVVEVESTDGAGLFVSWRRIKYTPAPLLMGPRPWLATGYPTRLFELAWAQTLGLTESQIAWTEATFARRLPQRWRAWGAYCEQFFVEDAVNDESSIHTKE